MARTATAASAAAATLAALALAGCGTPAVVKPASAPLPGLSRDIGAAQNAVRQTEAQAQGDVAATGATAP
jgi:hypothetical protein